MHKQLDKVNFMLTHDMSLLLIEFDKNKKKLLKLKRQYNLNKNDEQLLLQIDKLEKKLNIIRNNFIKKFRQANVYQINEYLKIKDNN
jgi:hypothetical protein